MIDKYAESAWVRGITSVISRMSYRKRNGGDEEEATAGWGRDARTRLWRSAGYECTPFCRAGRRTAARSAAGFGDVARTSSTDGDDRPMVLGVELRDDDASQRCNRSLCS
jgi:hypothetical protein